MTRTITRNKLTEKRLGEFRGQLLAWYDANRRTLPWRGQTDPYRIWLSEIMLQQTTVNAVIPYYLRFLEKWPDIHALAAAQQEDVMNQWAGLGYYSRARNLHACAQVVARELNGCFPREQAALKGLPGIGDYTSAAITAIAFNQPASVVDGNVERVMARYFAVEEPLPGAKKTLKSLAAPFFSDYQDRPGDLAQAFMDLGATVCIPSAPRCGLCPVSSACAGRKNGRAAALPRKSRTARRPVRSGEVYWITNNKGQVLLHRRPQKGLLGGMLGLPTSEWRAAEDLKIAPEPPAFIKRKSVKNPGKSPVKILHSFTHFDLELHLKTVTLNGRETIADGYFWQKQDDLSSIGLPTVFAKALSAIRAYG